MRSSFTNTLTAGLMRAAQRMPEEIRRAGTVAGLAVLDDAVNEEPTPPIDTGFLRGSGFVRVDGVTVQGAAPPGQSRGGQVTIEVGFGTPYAHYQHQGLPDGPGINGRHLKPGPKSVQAGDVGGLFLSTKLDRNRQTYARIVARKLRAALQGKA